MALTNTKKTVTIRAPKPSQAAGTQKQKGRRVPTTITLEEAIKADAQLYAQERGWSLSYLVEQGLRMAMGEK